MAQAPVLYLRVLDEILGNATDLTHRVPAATPTRRERSLSPGTTWSRAPPPESVGARFQRCCSLVGSAAKLQCFHRDVTDPGSVAPIATL